MPTSMKPLTESVLRRLTNDALTTFLGESKYYECAARPGLQMTLSNEPVAEMNMLIVGAGADQHHFRDMALSCLERQQPFLVMIYPEAGGAIDELAAELGLFHASDTPVMVRDDMPLEPMGNPDVEVSLAHGDKDADANADVLVSAYNMPKDSLLRNLPASLFDTPGADIYIARIDGEAVGTVTISHHGDTCGIWAMGTDVSRQRGGIGLRLLSTAIAEVRKQRTQRCFLLASPAGFRLYEKLGFETARSLRVWVQGGTHQA